VNERRSGRIFRLCPEGGGPAVEFNRGAVPDRLVIEGTASVQSTEFYTSFYQGEASQALAEHRRRQMPQLASLAGLDSGSSLTCLDVGCGSGIAVRYLNEWCPGVRAYGIDPGLTMDDPALFRASFEDRRSVEGLPPSFDVIAFLDVLEHFPDPAPILREAQSALVPGGRLLIKVPTRSALIYGLARRLRRIAPFVSRRVLRRLYQLDYTPPHYFYFDLPSLTALLNDAGFIVERHAYLSEMPLAHLWARLWGMRLPVRLGAFACLVPLRAFATRERSECLAVVARART
jgi:SAM-dependent methyltransferase